jgi:hypothetical protein
MTCQPLGIPRHGPPRRIVQSDRDVIFFYTQYADGGGGAGEYRIIPIDGRKHDPRRPSSPRCEVYELEDITSQIRH